MKLLKLAIGIFTVALLASTAYAAPGPYAPGKAHEQRNYQHHHKHQPQHRYPSRQEQRRHPQGQSQWQWQNQREMHRSPAPRIQRHHQRPPHQNHRHPPHRDQLRRDIHRNSHHLHRGPPPPRHVHLVVGRPLPHGWGHRVPPGQLKHLPHYAGYEWHSAGRDLLLVAATTGIVFSILDNVLN